MNWPEARIIARRSDPLSSPATADSWEPVSPAPADGRPKRPDIGRSLPNLVLVKKSASADRAVRKGYSDA